jgi:predicted RNA-binding Zn-ribbon protein involved in translation (DUF1610 family)
MKFVNDEAHRCSEELARERGCFANWRGSIWHTKHNRMMRNAAVTTVAPTGTISIIANCSGGIEPMFSLAFIRNVLKGQKQGDKPLVEVNDTFREIAVQRGFYSDDLIERIARAGTVAHLNDVPDDVKRVFVCAHDIAPEWHMKMQAAFQQHCDASISKTINFANDATRDDVEQIYRLAFETGCKGVTVYRDGCRNEQPMALKTDTEKAEPAEKQEKEEKTETVSEVAVEPVTARDPSAGVRMDSPLTDPAPVATLPPSPQYIEPMDLPEIVSGFRIRQMTPFGNMHVKITVDPRSEREQEVFAQLGKGGDVANGDLEAICRMISLWLRAGGSLRLVIKQLEGIGTSLQIPTRSGRIMSLGDGLACALKKYSRAKDRFGLRALLLGEMDLAELDNPHPAPHLPATTPVDRPVTPGNGNGGNVDGKAKDTPLAKPQERATTAPAETHSAPTAATVAKPAAPAACQATAGNGNGKGNGHDHAPLPDVGVAVLEAPAARPAKRIDLRTETATNAAAAPPAKVHVIKKTELASVLGEVRHKHDSAAFYKVMCPDCGTALMRQEGCRKCPACGWSAC